MTIRVVIVDDHALVRDGLRWVLESQPDITVVGEAGDSGGALARVAETLPDVVLLDVEIPGDEVTKTVRRIAELSQRTAVIILSMYDGPQLLRRLLATGIRGYLIKSAGRQELIAAVRGAAEPSGPVLVSVSRESLAQAQRGDAGPLTARETEILQLAAHAMTNGQIARALGHSEATVKRDLRNVFAKLGAVSRIDAVNKGIAASLISAPPHD